MPVTQRPSVQFGQSLYLFVHIPISSQWSVPPALQTIRQNLTVRVTLCHCISMTGNNLL